MEAGMKAKYIKKIIQMAESGEYNQTTRAMCKENAEGECSFCIHGLAVEALAQENQRFVWEAHDTRLQCRDKKIGTCRRLRSIGRNAALAIPHMQALGMELAGGFVGNMTREQDFWHKLLRANDRHVPFKDLAAKIREYYASQLKGWKG
jgi:hypothetical protein